MAVQYKHQLIPLLSDTESKPAATLQMAIANAEVGHEQLGDESTVTFAELPIPLVALGGARQGC